MPEIVNCQSFVVLLQSQTKHTEEFVFDSGPAAQSALSYIVALNAWLSASELSFFLKASFALF
jgi:hypothetical protein